MSSAEIINQAYCRLVDYVNKKIGNTNNLLTVSKQIVSAVNEIKLQQTNTSSYNYVGEVNTEYGFDIEPVLSTTLDSPLPLLLT